jgi:hypothetical protein
MRPGFEGLIASCSMNRIESCYGSFSHEEATVE